MKRVLSDITTAYIADGTLNAENADIVINHIEQIAAERGIDLQAEMKKAASANAHSL